ncbi:MAG TPA: MltA domain-containing protein [Polyangia bacterium]|nr:MltA domain-containing protein [Polyangia bacterium]
MRARAWSAVALLLGACAAPRQQVVPKVAAELPPPIVTTPIAPPPIVPPIAPVPLAIAEPPPLRDDLPLAPLLDAVEQQAAHLEQTSRIEKFDFGARHYSKIEYVAALRRFVALGRAARSPDEWTAAVAREFDFYEVRLGPDVLVTAYYEPLVEGAHAPSARFSQPLYRAPPDLVAGRPYHTRAEIDSGGALAGRGLELCWVDPFDAFVLQTEGSGVVRFPDGARLALDHAATNNQPHQRLSKFLAGAIPRETMTMHTIEAYLRALPERAMRDVLEKNPRYGFFKPRTGRGAATSIGLPAVDGRTLAADASVLPKGALAFLVTTQPRFADEDALVPAAWEPLARFVLDQDTGGGIVGAHVDLYWGEGKDAGRYAGVMKQRGHLYYLAPK